MVAWPWLRQLDFLDNRLLVSRPFHLAFVVGQTLAQVEAIPIFLEPGRLLLKSVAMFRNKGEEDWRNFKP